ncbi:hypothetical protein DBR27_09235 [Flavobacterium sp. HMWF030]|nr:hypothetical protein DBR27_09235 [Flavobacterium sp. HMWF030]
MKNIFLKKDSTEIINRINDLKTDSTAVWGSMSVAQMLAHCNVTYEMVYDNIHPKPNGFMRFILKSFIKNGVVNEKPYPKNSRTAPQFIVKGDRDFELEKNRLISYIVQTQELGEKEFEGKESLSFGKLTAKEWNNMFAKHLDHHLTQFGV